MKTIITLITLFALAATLGAKTDDFRSAVARATKEQLNVPVKYAGVTLTNVFYAKEVVALVYTYIGKPEKYVVASQANSYWAGSGGAELRKQGFKDAIYAYGYRNEEYGLYSCAEKKWYSGITAYLKAKGVPTG